MKRITIDPITRLEGHVQRSRESKPPESAGTGAAMPAPAAPSLQEQYAQYGAGKIAPPPQPPQQPQQQAPKPPSGLAEAAKAAATGQSQVSPLIAQAKAAATDATQNKPTIEEILKQQQALSPSAITEDAINKRAEEQKRRAEEERQTYERNKPSAVDELISMWGQAGKSKGLSGVGPAYTAMQQQKRAEEQNMAQRRNELLTAAESAQAKDSGTLFSSRSSAFSEANKQWIESLKSKAENLARLADTDTRAINSALDRLNSFQIAKLRTLEGTTGSERLIAQILKLESEGKSAEAERLLKINTLVNRGSEKEGSLESKINAQIAVVAGSNYPSEMKNQLIADLKAQLPQETSSSEFLVKTNEGTYKFPTKKAADEFKAKAGIK